MKLFKQYSIEDYLNVLSERKPVPGGGSAAALTGAAGAALISMVTNYSLGKGSPVAVEKKLRDLLVKSENYRQRFIELVDLDSQAYLAVVESKNKSEKEKKHAQRQAQQVPKEVCKLCSKAVDLAPYLVQHGNKYLLSDVEVAVELLLAAFNSARILTKTV